MAAWSPAPFTRSKPIREFRGREIVFLWSLLETISGFENLVRNRDAIGLSGRFILRRFWREAGLPCWFPLFRW
jgi:hypothetical protein